MDAATFQIDEVRAAFPILSRRVGDNPLVYLDNAATSQKPQCVVDVLASFYNESNANIHRGVHRLSVEATDRYEKARQTVQRFINADQWQEIVFLRGATEAMNLVAQSYGMEHVSEGDEVLVSEMEHHSNIVPWQMLCKDRGAVLKVIPIDDDGAIRMDEYRRLLSPKTRIVAVTHVSNSLGTINPIRTMAALAKEHGAVIVVDGAQAVPHVKVDVKELDCDFYAFSGHKAFGPTGVGALYGRRALLDSMRPYQGGGEMILSVTFEETSYNDVPFKFEAGTPNIAGAVGLGEAIAYMERVGLDRIEAYENYLSDYTEQALQRVDGLRLIGTAKEKVGVFSFTLSDVHAHDIGTILDGSGVAVRTGHHCTQPVMDRFGVPATTRASLAFYNTTEEIDCLVESLQKVAEIFGR